MEKSYILLLSLVIFLLLFIYFSWFFVSLKLIKQKEPELFQSNANRRKELWKLRNLIDSKNKSLSWIDLGNHILIIGVIILAIFILKNT